MPGAGIMALLFAGGVMNLVWIAGLAIIEAIMEKWDYDSFISVDAGLLEGNWINSYAK